MKKILLPTDFSENSYNAISYALRLYHNEECKFYLLNTYTPILYDAEFISYNSPNLSLETIYQRNSLEGLERVEKRILKDFNNPLHQLEKISSFSLLNEEIKEQVKNKEIDLVVMGTQGATGALQILFGTHTVHAIKKATSPLLAIPSGYQYLQPRNILFPTDFDINYTKEHLFILKNIVANAGAVVNVLHVNFGYPLEPKQEKAKAILKDYLQDTPHHFYNVEDNTVAKGIYQFQKEKNVEMMVMISNKHSFFENLLFRPVINEIGFHLKIPLLVIPSGKFNK